MHIHGEQPIKIFYDARQSVASNNSFSPSAGKPAKVLESWQRLEIPLEVCCFKPLDVDEIALAHDRRYVERVLALEEENGFGNKNPEVAAALPWVCGSMVAAALHSLKTGELSLSPTSGAHHACYSEGGYFCTFNFLVIAAMKAQMAGASKVGILDLDCHCGNGTDDIIKQLGLSFIRHYTFGRKTVKKGISAIYWLKKLPKILKDFSNVDLLIYNAGVDSHINDPLGGIFTTPQLMERDLLVFRHARHWGLKVCVSLAGGYQQDKFGDISKVLTLHDNTLKAGWREYTNHPTKNQTLQGT